jgi:hypothetical protein
MDRHDEQNSQREDHHRERDLDHRPLRDVHSIDEVHSPDNDAHHSPEHSHRGENQKLATSG